MYAINEKQFLTLEKAIKYAKRTKKGGKKLLIVKL